MTLETTMEPANLELMTENAIINAVQNDPLICDSTAKRDRRRKHLASFNQ